MRRQGQAKYDGEDDGDGGRSIRKGGCDEPWRSGSGVLLDLNKSTAETEDKDSRHERYDRGKAHGSKGQAEPSGERKQEETCGETGESR